MTDKWIGNSKPWLPVTLKELDGHTITPEGLSELGEAMLKAFDSLVSKEAQMTTVHTSQPKWRPSDPEQEPKNPELYSKQKAWDELQYRSWSGPIFNGQDTSMTHLPEQSK